MKRRPGWILFGLACVSTPFLACFSSVLFSGEQFAYRDAGHFYYPLYKIVQNEWSAGRIPLWEVEENAGMPLLGNPTAAVLYPGKLIYALFPYAWGARLYVIAHVLLALAGTYALLRSWDRSRSAAAIGALSYAFAAPILFQYCNIIFLVGAAWTPIAFRGADRWIRRGLISGIFELAIALAMQTLGGDPESTYLIGVFAAIYAILYVFHDPANGSKKRFVSAIIVILLILAFVTPLIIAGELGSLSRVRDRAWWIDRAPRMITIGVAVFWTIAAVFIVLRARAKRRFGALFKTTLGLGLAGTLAFLISAAQLLPGLEFTSLTSRASSEGPHEIFPFSLHPFRVVEFFWPNVFGSSVGRNRHWLELLPTCGNQHIWVPSLYSGGAAILLAISAFGFRSGSPIRTWLSLVFVISLVASFGEYGDPVWWGRETKLGAAKLGPHDPIDRAYRSDGLFPDGDGGLYGLTALALPGFRRFRYPGKLITFTCFAMSGLAAIGWDRLRLTRSRRFWWGAISLVVVSVVALGATASARRSIVAAFRASATADPSIFGPFEANESLIEIQSALVQGAVVFAVAIAAAKLIRTRPRIASALVLLCISIDLAIADASLIVTVPQADFEKKPHAIELIEKAEKADPSAGPFRIFRMHVWEPNDWLLYSSSDRYHAIMRWERDTLQPKYGLPYGICYAITKGTAELYDYEFFFGPFMMSVKPAIASALSRASFGQEVAGARIVCHPRRGYDLWGARYFLVPAMAAGWVQEHRGYASFLPRTEPVYPERDAFEGRDRGEKVKNWIMKEDFQILRNLDAFPRAWAVHEIRTIEPIKGLERAARAKIVEKLLYKNDGLWSDPTADEFDLGRTALVEIDRDQEAKLARYSRGGGSRSEKVDVTIPEPTRVELKAKLDAPGIVVLADVYYPGWRLYVDGRPAPILRVNRMMRGAAVDKGEHKLTYIYEPESFRIGVALTAAGLAIVLAGCAIGSFRVLASIRTRNR